MEDISNKEDVASLTNFSRGGSQTRASNNRVSIYREKVTGTKYGNLDHIGFLKALSKNTHVIE